jgi:hypothetical protein
MACIIHTPMCEEGCNIKKACMVSSELWWWSFLVLLKSS